MFGRDVSQIPCFRESFLYGIGSGVILGLGAFMSTSKPRLATSIGFSSYIMITLSFWCYCRYVFEDKNGYIFIDKKKRYCKWIYRYEWSRQRLIVQQIQEGMRRNAIYQGTDLHKEIVEEFEREDEEEA